jgi:hypothetical protein
MKARKTQTKVATPSSYCPLPVLTCCDVISRERAGTLLHLEYICVLTVKALQRLELMCVVESEDVLWVEHLQIWPGSRGTRANDPVSDSTNLNVSVKARLTREQSRCYHS